jgi:Fe-S cluster assembly ATP-binding protein
MYHLVQPTHVHVVLDGHIAMSGGIELINRIDQEGYQWLKQEFGLDISDKVGNKPMIVMQNCAAKTRGPIK